MFETLADENNGTCLVLDGYPTVNSGLHAPDIFKHLSAYANLHMNMGLSSINIQMRVICIDALGNGVI